MSEAYHIPAMLRECIEGLNISADGTYADLTFGGGGHSRGILERLTGKGRLYSFDQDIEAFEHAMEDEFFRNEDADVSPAGHWRFVYGNFRYLEQWMDYYGESGLDGVIADLGVSFHHFDTADRGFSFRFDGPLDMRMNRIGGKKASDVVNGYEEEELQRVLWKYGELKNARHIAHKIAEARKRKPIERTEELAALTGQDKKVQTLVFQALRMEVNDELGALEQMLVSAGKMLRKGGRIVVLSYHSLEDRIVKNYLRSGNTDGRIEKDFYGNILTPFEVIEKGRTADAAEVESNPRARSAKLRIAIKK